MLPTHCPSLYLRVEEPTPQLQNANPNKVHSFLQYGLRIVPPGPGAGPLSILDYHILPSLYSFGSLSPLGPLKPASTHVSDASF